MKRSSYWRAIVTVPAMCLIAIGCGPSASELQFRHMIKDTEKSVRSSDVRAAVTPLFSKYRGFDYTNCIPANELPAVIKSLPLFAHRENIIAFSMQANPNVLVFMTGSGYGHWGIAVCEDQNGTEPNLIERKGYRLWGNGVYFFRE
jgi:hypothetical protein